MTIEMERPTISGVPAAELAQRAESLIPLLRANAAATEDARRVSEQNIRAIHEAYSLGL